tara:strand:+ start:823 stop:1314 length:492 start_codon:yes stop_codon:yes gene_type:complete
MKTNGRIKTVLVGACSCGHVRYELHAQPMFIHCCHCSWCQRETGSAFAVNALIESSNIVVLEGETKSILMPSNSGAGQTIVRCKQCESALWSYYGAAKERVSFVRVGTLENAISMAPDIHIYTASKQDWVNLGGAVPAVEEYYRRSEYWPIESIERYQSVMKT